MYVFLKLPGPDLFHNRRIEVCGYENRISTSGHPPTSISHACLWFTSIGPHYAPGCTTLPGKRGRINNQHIIPHGNSTFYTHARKVVKSSDIFACIFPALTQKKYIISVAPGMMTWKSSIRYIHYDISKIPGTIQNSLPRKKRERCPRKMIRTGEINHLTGTFSSFFFSFFFIFSNRDLPPFFCWHSLLHSVQSLHGWRVF